MQIKGECWYCDNCGDMVYSDSGDVYNPHRYTEYKAFEVYERVPWNVDSANKGESAVLCMECVIEFKGREEVADG